MTDKNWMLNPTAISQARSCISIIQDELGVKLKLSHPQFLELIYDYIELTDSQELADAYNVLASFAGSNLPAAKILKPKAAVTEIASKMPSAAAKKFPVTSDVDQQDMIEYRGKYYPRFSAGGEFKGLYRGQARYA